MDLWIFLDLFVAVSRAAHIVAGMGTAAGLRGRWQVPLCVLFCWLCGAVSGQIQYTVPEEMQRGAIVGNIAKDLGLNERDLSDRQLRVISAAGNQHFTLNAETGTLQINHRIDREEMCGESASCSVTFEAIAQNPLTVFYVEVVVKDVNDNPPRFEKNSFDLEIPETTSVGARISIGSARDPDIGINSLQRYELSPNQHFVLEEKKRSDGNIYAELVLEKALDRETQSHHHLTLTASDGGEPIRTSSVAININVLDVNDNFPVFSQESYRASISEGAPNNTVALQVRATDSDEDLYSKITYSISSTSNNVLDVFNLDADTGKITVKGSLDFEKTNSYRIGVEAKDGGGLVADSVVLVEIIDENDNAPEITLTSVTTPIPEDTPVGTLVALINIDDQDSGENGQVACHIEENDFFKLISSSGKYYKVVTANFLNREASPAYTITVTATDKGSSPLTTRKTIHLQLSDINDNPPEFEQTAYQIHVPENNPPGVSIYRVKAFDLDLDQNARITYSMLYNNNNEASSLASFISINSQTGVLYAQRSYDYEKVKDFQFQVKAQDSGAPPLSSNVTVRVVIVDKNDNPPEILYPALGADGAASFELVPPSSDPGYLISKVVAVDADSGHNSWLSYHLIQTPESSLFKIGLHTGEIRTARGLLEKDLTKQKIVILVKDNGLPPLSSTVTLNMVFTESMQEAMLPEIRNQKIEEDGESNMKVYLAVALALISLLFILTLMLIVIFKCRKPQGSFVVDTVAPGVYPHTDPRFTPNYHNGTLPLPYLYEIASALDSGKNVCNLYGSSQDVPTGFLVPASDSGIGAESLGGSADAENVDQFRPTTSEAAYDGRQRYISNVMLHKQPSTSTPST